MHNLRCEREKEVGSRLMHRIGGRCVRHLFLFRFSDYLTDTRTLAVELQATICSKSKAAILTQINLYNAICVQTAPKLQKVIGYAVIVSAFSVMVTSVK